MRVRSRFKKRFNPIFLKYILPGSDDLYRGLISQLSPRKFSNMMTFRVKRYQNDGKRKYKKNNIPPVRHNYVLYSSFDALSLLSHRGKRVSIEYYRHSYVERSRVKDIMEGYTVISVSTLIEKLNLNPSTTHRDLQNYNHRMNTLGDSVCSGIIKPTKGKLI